MPDDQAASVTVHDPMQPLIDELLQLIRRGAGAPPMPLNLAQVADGALRLLDQLEALRGAGTAQQAADIEELSGLVHALVGQTGVATLSR